MASIANNYLFVNNYLWMNPSLCMESMANNYRCSYEWIIACGWSIWPIITYERILSCGWSILPIITYEWILACGWSLWQGQSQLCRTVWPPLTRCPSSSTASSHLLEKLQNPPVMVGRFSVQNSRQSGQSLCIPSVDSRPLLCRLLPEFCCNIFNF